MSEKKRLTIETAPSDDRSLVPEEDAQYEEEYARKSIDSQAEYEDYLEREKQREIDERKAHEEKLRREKIELLQKKQGIVSEKETDDGEDAGEDEPAPKMTFWKRVENFWYHYKIPFIVAVVAILFGGYMIYDLVTKVNPDITVISVVDNGLSYRLGSMEDYLEKYATDLNGDGRVYVQVVHVPMDPSSTDTNAQNYATKLYSSLQSSETVLILTDKKSEYSVEMVSFQNLTERYPDNEYVTEKGVLLNSKKLSEALGWTQMPTDMVLMVREPVRTLNASVDEMADTCDDAMELIDKLLEDLK